MNTAPQAFSARWIVPGDGRVIEGGVVEIRDGRIVGVRSVASAVEPGTVDLGEVAILPGFVNCHAHLEFSELTNPLSPAVPFTDWLRALMAWRRGRTDQMGTNQIGTAILRGLTELAESGCTRVGEIATAGWSPRPEYLRGPVVHAFRESLGLRAEAVEDQMALVAAHFDECAGEMARGVARGERTAELVAAISPHAPYSVRPELLSRLLQQANLHGCTVAMHLAETRDELELLATGSGPFVDFLAGLGVWRPEAVPAGRRPLDVLRELATAPRGLVVHGNYLVEDELDFLAEQTQLSLVYCPRTHAYFQHEPHPWRALLSRGGRVVLGTDGRGSNPDLSVFREAQFLSARHGDVDPAVLLAMLTRDAAAALMGPHADFGRIAAGYRADLTIVALPRGRSPLEDLFHPETRPVGTLVGGRWLVSPAVVG